MLLTGSSPGSRLSGKAGAAAGLAALSGRGSALAEEDLGGDADFDAGSAFGLSGAAAASWIEHKGRFQEI